jgi:hypothetical protein
MNTALLNRTMCATLGLLSLLWAGNAYAAHPASVGGTWTATGNLTTGQLVISQGAGTTCRVITGTIFNSAIEGNYCPAVGRIVFVRKLSNGVPFQLYEGYVSQDATVDRIGGTFKIWNAAGGAATTDGLDYNFNASK